MRCITIQHKSVYEKLIKNGKYTIEIDSLANNDIRKKPYQFMMQQYGYKHCPIFLSPIGYNVEMGGANIKDAVAMEFEIPDRYCKVQDYYNWSDVIYFMELPQEWESTERFKTAYDFFKYAVNKNNNNICTGVYQVTTQMLLASWLVCAKDVPLSLIDAHIDTGGRNILHSLNYYK